jgi:hypothetical protein
MVLVALASSFAISGSLDEILSSCLLSWPRGLTELRPGGDYGRIAILR